VALHLPIIATKAKADSVTNLKEGAIAIVGETTLQEIFMKHPNFSQTTQISDGTSVIYAYQNTFNNFALKSYGQIRGTNAIEFIFDKNKTLSSINLIAFKTPKEL
jgi:hypothetical protein